MIDAVLSLLGSSVIGTIVGGGLAFMNRKADIETKKADHLHDQAKWAHDLNVKDKDLEYAKIESQGRKDVAFVEGEARVDAARFTAIAVAHAGDKTGADEIKVAGKLRWIFVLASAFNKIIRPSATVILTTAALYVNWLFISKLGANWADMTVEQQIAAATDARNWIAAQAAICISYWFVARGSSAK